MIEREIIVEMVLTNIWRSEKLKQPKIAQKEIKFKEIDYLLTTRIKIL